MRKHFLTLNCTLAETQYHLNQELRVAPPKGKVAENQFRIYKQLPNLFFGSSLKYALYCFYGNYQQAGNKTHVSYRIIPGFTILSYYLLLILSTLYMFCLVIRKDMDMITAVVLLGFLLFFTLITQVAKKKCKTEFEQLLTEKVHHKK